jgi:excisionase family DNA binding protein
MSLRDAARETGVTKSTILRAIQRGRLSAARDDDGNYRIEAAELFRVYEPRTTRTDAQAGAAGQDAPAGGTGATALQAEIEGLRAQLALMREHAGAERDQHRALVDDLRAQRDSWQKQAETSQRLLADQRPRRRGLFGFLKAS